MSRRRPNHKSVRRGRPWLVVALVLCGFAAGVGIYLALHRTASAPPEQPSERPATMEIHRPTRAVKIFLPKNVGSETYLVPIEVKVPATADLPKVAMEQLIAASEKGGSSANLISKGTRLLAARVGKGIAEVDFSKEFVNNFNGGSHQEALTLNAILHTMAQFPGVRRIQILVEGKTTDTLGGHFEIAQPLVPDPAWLESSSVR